MLASCKIFEHFSLQVVSSNWVHKTQIHSTLAPKLANRLSFWRSGSTFFKYWIKYSWSGLTHILYCINMSVRWNTLLRNQILLCQRVFYYTCISYKRQEGLDKVCIRSPSLMHLFAMKEETGSMLICCEWPDLQWMQQLYNIQGWPLAGPISFYLVNAAFHWATCQVDSSFLVRLRSGKPNSLRWSMDNHMTGILSQRILKGGMTVPLASCLTGLD